MSITLKNLLKHELIGLKVIVTKSENLSEVGISGELVNETKNTLVIQTPKGDKSIQKLGREFVFTVDKNKIKINGGMIVSRPEDRIKKKVKRWR